MMDRSDVEKLAYKELRALKELVDTVVDEKREEAVAEYKTRAEHLATEYGFKVGAGFVGRPRKKKRKTKERVAETTPIDGGDDDQKETRNGV